jgi:hypothetical protein
MQNLSRHKIDAFIIGGHDPAHAISHSEVKRGSRVLLLLLSLVAVVAAAAAVTL